MDEIKIEKNKQRTQSPEPLDVSRRGLKSHLEVKTSKVASNWNLSIGRASSEYWPQDQLFLFKLQTAPVGDSKPGPSWKRAVRHPQTHKNNLAATQLKWFFPEQRRWWWKYWSCLCLGWTTHLVQVRNSKTQVPFPKRCGPRASSHYVPVRLWVQVSRCTTMTCPPWRKPSVRLWQKWIPNPWARICFGHSEAP